MASALVSFRWFLSLNQASRHTQRCGQNDLHARTTAPDRAPIGLGDRLCCLGPCRRCFGLMASRCDLAVIACPPIDECRQSVDSHSGGTSVCWI
jgi:hypothetical protein